MEESSILKVLFDTYVDKDSVEHEEVKQCFRNLYALLDNIPNDTLDAVTDTVCSMCHTSEYAGFVGGMQTAIRLANELKT